MKKIARMTAAILLVFLLSGCVADTIYIQIGTQTTTAAPTTTESIQTSTEDPTELLDDTMVWIPTKGGKKYHKTATCSSMQDPKQVAREEAETQGFSPCKHCYP